MARLGINTGAAANDGNGDTLRVTGGKLNDNFLEIYNYLGAGSTDTLSTPLWRSTTAGINTLSNVGIGTTNPRFALEVGAVGASGTSLWVNGDARITGILTIGTASITINGSTNTINVGSGITINGSAGIISATSIVVGGQQITGNSTGTGGTWATTTVGIHTLKNVGIGTTNPTSALTVKGNTSLETLNVSGVSTFTGNVSFGSSALFGYNKIIFGSGNSLEIGHSGGGAQIYNFGGGKLVLQSSDEIEFRTPTGFYARFTENYGALLYDNNNQIRLQTLGAGVTITGTTFTNNLDVSGVSTFNGGTYYNSPVYYSNNPTRAYFGSLNEMSIYSTGTYLGKSSNFIDASSGYLDIRNYRTTIRNSENITQRDLAVFDANTFNAEFVKLYYGGNEKFATIGVGVTVTGTTFTNQLNVSGVVTAASFVGDGSGLTGVIGSGSGVIIQDSGSPIGTAGTINFGDNLTVSPVSAGVVTVTASGGTIAGINTTGTSTFNQLSVSGVSTFPINVSVGVDFAHQGNIGKFRISGDSVYGNGRIGFYDSSNNLKAAWDSNLSTGNIDIYNYTNSGTQNITISAGSSVVLQHGGTNTKLQTLGTGVTVTGTTFTSQLNVSGVSTVGIITGATYYGDASNAADGRWTLGANGTSDYTFTGIGFTQTTNDPVLYLARGSVYEFVNNSGGAHPFQIRQSNGGSAYNNGVTNNGSASGTIRFEVPFDAPNTLYYQCTSHSGMGATIFITPRNEPAVGVRTTVTATTGSIGAGSSATLDITGFKSYGLLKVGISSAAWVTLYADSSSRTSDVGRSYFTDPTPGSGVIAEVRTTSSGASTFLMSPGVIGWNNDSPTASTIYARVTNNESSNSAITVNLTVVKLED